MDRVDFTEDGTLDEIVASGGAHLERIDEDRWFLIFCHEDGSETALWFTSKDLVQPFWEKRKKRRAGQATIDSARALKSGFIPMRLRDNGGEHGASEDE